MIQPFGNIRFFDSVNKISNMYSFYEFPIIWNHNTYLPFFQIFREDSSGSITTFKLIDPCHVEKYDLISAVSTLDITEHHSLYGLFESVCYDGGVVSSAMNNGFYYIHIADAKGDYYSSVFKIEA